MGIPLQMKLSKHETKKGDGTGVGLFIPLSDSLASQFPSLGEEDRSPSHCTFLYIGQVDKDQEERLIQTIQEVFSGVRGTVRGSLFGPDYFVHPAKERRVAVMRVRFSQDLAKLRSDLWSALQDNGFDVDDSFPLVYSPHVTLEYLTDTDEEYTGNIPHGDWVFNGMEVWGLSKVYAVPFGEVPVRKTVSPEDIVPVDPKDVNILHSLKLIGTDVVLARKYRALAGHQEWVYLHFDQGLWYQVGFLTLAPVLGENRAWSVANHYLFRRGENVGRKGITALLNHVVPTLYSDLEGVSTPGARKLWLDLGAQVVNYGGVSVFRLSRDGSTRKTASVIAYHGTQGGFDHLDPDKSGLGTHFGDYRTAAKRMKYHRDHFDVKSPEIRRYQLNISHPLRMPDLGAWDDQFTVAGNLRDMDIIKPDPVSQLRGWPFIRDQLEKAGYDSIVYPNKLESAGSLSYIVWDNSLVKRLPDAKTPQYLKSASIRVAQRWLRFAP